MRFGFSIGTSGLSFNVGNGRSSRNICPPTPAQVHQPAGTLPTNGLSIQLNQLSSLNSSNTSLDNARTALAEQTTKAITTALKTKQQEHTSFKELTTPPTTAIPLQESPTEKLEHNDINANTIEQNLHPKCASDAEIAHQIITSGICKATPEYEKKFVIDKIVEADLISDNTLGDAQFIQMKPSAGAGTRIKNIWKKAAEAEKELQQKEQDCIALKIQEEKIKFAGKKRARSASPKP